VNGLAPAAHDFIYGDAFDWLRRLAKKGRAFDAVALDPPTFSQSKERAFFARKRILENWWRPRCRWSSRAESCLPRRMRRTGHRKNSRGRGSGGSRRETENCATPLRPATPDFPISRGEPAYLKTVWLRIG